MIRMKYTRVVAQFIHDEIGGTMVPLELEKPCLHAYQLSKRGNSLRVMAEAVRWGKRGARIDTISPGIIITPLAKDELTGPRGDGYRRMIELSPVGRAGTPDEVGSVGALLKGQDGAFITGSDFLNGRGSYGFLLVRRTRSAMRRRDME